MKKNECIYKVYITTSQYGEMSPHIKARIAFHIYVLSPTCFSFTSLFCVVLFAVRSEGASEEAPKTFTLEELKYSPNFNKFTAEKQNANET